MEQSATKKVFGGCFSFDISLWISWGENRTSIFFFAIYVPLGNVTFFFSPSKIKSQILRCDQNRNSGYVLMSLVITGLPLNLKDLLLLPISYRTGSKNSLLSLTLSKNGGKGGLPVSCT